MDWSARTDVQERLHANTEKQRHLSPVIGSGDVTFCSLETGCNPVVENLKFPNGLARGKDGLIYVPSSVAGTIGIFESLPGHGLQKIDEIKTGYSIDNISVDKNGELFVALFPVGFGVFKAFDDPWGSHPASAAMRVSKNEDGYQFEKAIEDGLGEVLPAATTVVHDAKTGRFFFSSKYLP